MWAFVSFSSAAKWKYVKMSWPRFMCEQRQFTRRQLDRFVSDARRAARDVGIRELLVGGKMEVREDELAALHVRPAAVHATTARPFRKRRTSRRSRCGHS